MLYKFKKTTKQKNKRSMIMTMIMMMMTNAVSLSYACKKNNNKNPKRDRTPFHPSPNNNNNNLQTLKFTFFFSNLLQKKKRPFLLSVRDRVYYYRVEEPRPLLDAEREGGGDRQLRLQSSIFALDAHGVLRFPSKEIPPIVKGARAFLEQC